MDNQTNGNRATLLQFEDEQEAVEPSKIDSLLKFESEEEAAETPVALPEEDPALVQTHHSPINSPWSRSVVVGGGFGMVFLLVFLFLNPMFNPVKKPPQRTAKIEQPANPSPPSESKQDDKVRAELALAKQEEELRALQDSKPKNRLGKAEKSAPRPSTPSSANSNPTPQPTATPATNRTVNPPPSTRQTASLPPPPRSATRTYTPQPRTLPPPPPPVTRTYTPPPRTLPPAQAIAPPIAQTRIVQPTPAPQPVAAPNSPSIRVPASPPPNPTAKNEDPMSHWDRLAQLGSAGRVRYPEPETDSGEQNNAPPAPQPVLAQNNASQTTNAAPNTQPQEPERLLPRFPVAQGSNSTVPVATQIAAEEPITGSLATPTYLPEEAAIINGTPPQYLIVGEFAKARLITPIVWSDTQAQNRRFVAQLIEPLASNTGEIAVPAGSLVALQVETITEFGECNVQVTSILKDENEYPVSPGAIQVLGAEGNPLVASKYDDKGPELFSADATLGVLGGLARATELMNEPDVQESSETERPDGTVRRTNRSQRSRRPSLMMGFAEGAFSALNQNMGRRTQTQIQETLKRKNIWVIESNTEISIRVSRSLKL
jgi:Bacterial conjugation TrbI-like protein